ncbi:hypothetical protein DMH04_01905 [Kibdelosporangium aridum]|uniref:Uncharacterized protein n=1 Tax=Kibdelosporangium aridum TaxID=2030 RepID=A0A428ZUJ4_KIBAR|nr:hypothetical protein DMH04_01905 [Kibdelosporangium aridum]
MKPGSPVRNSRLRYQWSDPAHGKTAKTLAGLVGGERCLRAEPPALVSMLMLLLLTGHSTTVNLISNGMLALMTNPARLALPVRLGYLRKTTQRIAAYM